MFWASRAVCALDVRGILVSSLEGLGTEDFITYEGRISFDKVRT